MNIDFKAKFNELKDKLGKRNMIIIASSIIAVLLIILIVCLVCCNTGKNTYTITYELNGGTISESAPKSYTTEKGDIVIVNPTKDGYTFLGWTTDSITTPTKDLIITKGTTGDLTLTANWQVSYYSYADNTQTSVYFGSYPQTKVTDDTLIATLTEKTGGIPSSFDSRNWTNYGYYISGSVSSCMYYIDIDNDNDGTYDYRGVYINQYRPYYTTDTSSNTYQDDNGYTRYNIYWFKYEKVKWNILKTENGKALIVSDMLLDSQDYYYSTSTRSGATDYQGNLTTDTVYSNNYMYSYIREWLNETFYDATFNASEKGIIETTLIDNSAATTGSETNAYACGNTSDKIFLLSYKEATTYYSSDSERQAKGTDYAKSQGLYVSSGNSYYWLCSPGYDIGSYARFVDYGGSNNFNYVYDTSNGVRAACWINL